MKKVFKSLYESRKAWVGGISILVTVALNLLAPTLGLTTEQAISCSAAIVAFGLAIIGGIASDNKAEAGAAKPPVWLLALLILPLAGGCMGGHDFQLAAPKAIVEIAAQLDTGVGEYHAAENTQLLAAEAQARDRLQTALAEYVIKVAKAGGTATVAEAKAAIAPAFAAYDNDMAGITGDRQTESDRWRNMLELTEFARRVARQIAEIETLRYATYDELRALAKQAVSQAMTTAAKPAAVNGGAK